MRSELRIETKVLPGNKIEINLPADMLSSSVGQTIEVIVLLPEQKTNLERQSILQFLEEIHNRMTNLPIPLKANYGRSPFP